MAALYLGQVFDVLKLATNKERKGFIKDSQIITALKIGAWNYFQKELQKYRAGEEIPSPLRPFKKTASVTMAAGSGITPASGTLPSDFIKEISFAIPAAATPNDGEFLTESSFNDRLTSLLLLQTTSEPIAKIEGNTLFVSPVTLATPVNLQYVSRPIDFVYATTVDSDNKGTTYAAGSSTDLPFSQECYPDIIKEALIWLGIKAQDQAVMAISQTETEFKK
jgi:hypothetical protein